MTFEFPAREALAEPLYASLSAAIERQIREGRLRPGDRLPTHRAVSNELGLSVHTVSKAYERLRQHNLIQGHVGRGSYVVDPSGLDQPPYALKPQREDVLDLAISRPLYDAHHDQAMRRTLREMADTADPATILSCRPNIGQTAHRAAAVDWLARCRLRTSADRVLLTNGVTHGMAASLSAVTTPGDVVLADDVTHHLVISLCRYLGLTLVGVAGDDEGMCPDALERVCRGHDARAIVTLPNLATPRASLMGEARRRAIVGVARRRDLVIIENDVYAQILEDAPEPFAALAPDRSIYLTTFTKSTVSGLRAGYMAAPVQMQSALLSRLLVFSWAATPLVGEIATRWVRDGTAAALAEWQRGALAARGRIVAEVLGDQSLQGHPGGLHYWLTLPEGRSTDDIVGNARRLGVALAPATPFMTSQAPAIDAVRISVGGIRDESQFRTALERVSMLLQANRDIAFPLEYL